MHFWQKKEASRKFIDLINRTTGKYANWDPSIIFEVGDYGGIERQSGRFVREGNIYHDFADLVNQFQPVVGEPLDEYVVNSSNTTQCDLGTEARADIAGLAGVAFQGQWKFDDSRGALLVMHKPRISYVPDEFFSASLRHGLTQLNKKKLITQVFKCPAYALYLSGKNSETVSIALMAQSPVAIAPGVTAGGGVSAKWTTAGISGLFHEAHSDTEKFVPLYFIQELRRPRGTRRGTLDPNAREDNFWGEAEVPWGILDEDGEEDGPDDYTDESMSDSD